MHYFTLTLKHICHFAAHSPSLKPLQTPREQGLGSSISAGSQSRLLLPLPAPRAEHYPLSSPPRNTSSPPLPRPPQKLASTQLGQRKPSRGSRCGGLCQPPKASTPLNADPASSQGGTKVPYGTFATLRGWCKGLALAHGHLRIVPKVAHPFTKICNLFLKIATVPEDWRMVHVRPVFKKGTGPWKLQASLTWWKVSSKIKSKNIEELTLLGEKQHGFCKGKSCLVNLLEF